MIKFTDRAQEQLLTALETGEIVRVAVQGGGCAGMSYRLNIETEVDADDILLDLSGVNVYVDPYSADILKDTLVDYVAALHQQGFIFKNPNANTTCGCGSSFS